MPVQWPSSRAAVSGGCPRTHQPYCNPFQPDFTAQNNYTAQKKEQLNLHSHKTMGIFFSSSVVVLRVVSLTLDCSMDDEHSIYSHTHCSAGGGWQCPLFHGLFNEGLLHLSWVPLVCINNTEVYCGGSVFYLPLLRQRGQQQRWILIFIKWVSWQGCDCVLTYYVHSPGMRDLTA